MKRHFIYTTAILCLLTAYSNTPKSTTADNLTIIDLETALKSPDGEMKLSDLYTSEHYIPLETNDSSLVRSHPSVLMTDDKIIVTSFGNGILCHSFDRQTGQFIARTGHSNKLRLLTIGEETEDGNPVIMVGE